MAKKPTPSKRLSKDRGRTRHSVYLMKETKRLTDLAGSPYSTPALQRDRSGKALEKITRIKA